MNDSQSFYAGLTPFYHLIYPDWEGSIRRQAGHLDSVIREIWGSSVSSVLDASCGIGTQAYDVSMYLVEDRGGIDCRTHVFRSSYYPVGIERLTDLMKEAGFDDVRRIDARFFQPIIVGTKAQQYTF